MNYNVLTFNLKVGRDHSEVRSQLVGILHGNDVKVALLQECGGYRGLLHNIPGYTCFQWATDVDTANVAILVANDMVAKWAWMRRMKQRWWGAQNKKWRAPRTIASVRAGGVRWIDIHRVAYPGLDATAKANREIDAFLVDYLKTRKGRVALGGDWNNRLGDQPIMEFRKRTGLLYAGTGGIDFVMYRGGQMRVSTPIELDKGGSDHHPKVYAVSLAVL